MNGAKIHYMMSFPPIEKITDPDWTGAALRKTFDDFIQGTIPSAVYPLADLTRFVESLVRNQRGAGSFVVEPGSWSLISLDEGAPSDVRVDYIFFPTYYAVSLLTRFLLCYPEEAERISGYREALHKGFRFASMRQLCGHGIEGGAQREEAVEILMRGEVPEYLGDNVDEFPECRPLLDAILDYAKELEKRIDPKIVRTCIRLSDLKEQVSAHQGRSCSTVFRDIKIMNLGSGHDWMESVGSILADPKLWKGGVLPSISQLALHKRLSELKYVCLVDHLALLATRAAFPEKSNSGWFKSEFLETLLSRMSFPPTSDPDEDRENGNSRQVLPADSFPHYGCTESSASVSVAVDCYGMYVSSFKAWLNGISHSHEYHHIHECLDSLAEDGPAVLLCPEAIMTLYEELSGRESLARLGLDRGESLKMLLLKLTLLHEIGHHVFPVHVKRPAPHLSEALANWFVHCALPGFERMVLHEKTRTQSLPYRMYAGMLPIRYPMQCSWFSGLELPAAPPDGDNYAHWLERKAFHGDLRDPRFCNLLEIGDNWFRWLWEHGQSQGEDFLSVDVRQQVTIHPAEVMALILINGTIFFGASNKIERMEKDLRGKWHPMCSEDQDRWIARLSGVPW